VPPTQDWRARKRDETHQRIYDTAMRLFRERGYDHVNVGEIASASNVSVPTFYAHFPRKEEIVMPIPAQGEVDDVVNEQPAGLPVAERVRGAMLSWLARFGPEEREQLLDRWRVIIASPSLRNRAGELERTTAGLVLATLRGDAGGDGGPPVTDSVIVAASMSAYTQVLLRWAEDDGRQSLEEVAETVLAALREL
jgi:AcrR family transcriptional regulator